MHKHGRTDSNQTRIVELWRKCGKSVLILSDVGNGCPDTLVADANEMWLAEIKTDAGKLTPKEDMFIATWPRPVHVIRTDDDALRMIGAI